MTAERWDNPAVGISAHGREVLVRRSRRRRRTVTAFWEDGKAVVAIPAHFSRAEERRWVATMVARLEEPQGASRRRSDDDLMRRASELSARYLQGRAEPSSVRWVSNQKNRWGSATPADRSIRLSTALRGMPEWVVDYVLLHELAHLLVAGHGAAFWALLTAYPRTETAKAFLAGVSFAHSHGQPGEDDVDEDDDGDEVGAIP
ncbi:M48 family metallopeptidase [Psychromicrobium xiongbiense]|uniref:M48 metallopeptidase family protein n=1 Tax=Psychromicrobium xiongbiense TaxID=3051184 RepID=UPI00255651D0|nr:M48 family metallopeptidase [Psychromicrobium sp. YIM S02556]